jgi:RNA polymerase sigma-70 factor (ECF subfamily)
MPPDADREVRELYAGTYARLVAVLAVAAGNRGDAEEAVQEGFVQLLRHWRTVSRYDDPEAWVRQVAFRSLSNRRRKARNGVRALLRLDRAVSITEPSTDEIDIATALQSL